VFVGQFHSSRRILQSLQSGFCRGKYKMSSDVRGTSSKTSQVALAMSARFAASCRACPLRPHSSHRSRPPGPRRLAWVSLVMR
jgi:hypothetical protein